MPWSAKLHTLRELEAEVLASFHRANTAQPPPSAQINQLDKRLQLLTPVEFQNLLAAASALQLSDPTLSALARNVSESLNQWYEINQPLQEKLNQKIIAKQIFLLERSMAILDKKYSGLSSSGQNEKRPLFLALEGQYSRWQRYRHCIGDVCAKAQRERLYAFYEFFDRAEIFMESLGFSPERRPVNKKNGLLLKIARKIPLLFAKNPGDTKFFAFVEHLARTVWAANNYAVTISGEENLLSPAHHKKVRLYLPSHRTNIADNLLMAKLNLPHYIFFINSRVVAEFINHTYAKPIGNWLADRNGIVAVGDLRGKNNSRPGPRLLENLDKGVSHNVVNYPQGFTALFNEILPTNRNFTAKLLKPALAAGYQLEVVPITIDIASAFLESDWYSLEQGSELKIHQGLSPRLLTLITTLELHPSKRFQFFFSLIMRSFWLDHTARFPELSLEEINERLKRKIGIDILQPT